MCDPVRTHRKAPKPAHTRKPPACVVEQPVRGQSRKALHAGPEAVEAGAALCTEHPGHRVGKHTRISVHPDKLCQKALHATHREDVHRELAVRDGSAEPEYKLRLSLKPGHVVQKPLTENIVGQGKREQRLGDLTAKAALTGAGTVHSHDVQVLPLS